MGAQPSGLGAGAGGDQEDPARASLCSWRHDTEHQGLSGASCFILGGKVALGASAVGSTLLPYHVLWAEYLHSPKCMC